MPRWSQKRSSGFFHPANRLTSPMAESTLSTITFTIPCRLFFPLTSREGCSVPMVGNTLSLADRLTNKAKGISQTHNPKYEAISVNVGTSGWSYMDDMRA